MRWGTTARAGRRSPPARTTSTRPASRRSSARSSSATAPARRRRRQRAADGDGLRLRAGQPRGRAGAARGGRARDARRRRLLRQRRSRAGSSAAARAPRPSGCSPSRRTRSRTARSSTERGARHVRDFDGRPAVSIGASEQFALPRVHPGLRDVGVWLGWFGPASRPLQAAVGARRRSRRRLPGVRGAIDATRGALRPRLDRRPGRGDARAGALARRRDRVRRVRRGARDRPPRGREPVRLHGRDARVGRDARRRRRRCAAAGALGPVDGFGLDELERGVADGRDRARRLT